ncbi:MAG: hypothetical protein FWD64_10095, partial [Acidobacteriaceae bacterium]|nr:hypothetical protein [Acidobacteriaceae bacterium]
MTEKTQQIFGKENPPAKPLFGLLPEELSALAESMGQKKYRAVQIAEALYRQHVTALDAITVLPQALREELKAAGYYVGLPEIIQTARSVDGTERYLIQLADGETVETVWMPEGDGGERGDGSEAAMEEEAADGLEGNTSEFSAGTNLGAPSMTVLSSWVGGMSAERRTPPMRDETAHERGT